MKRALFFVWCLVGIPALTLAGFLAARRLFIEKVEQGARLGESIGGSGGMLADILGGAGAAFVNFPAVLIGPVLGAFLGAGVAFLMTPRGNARARAFFTR